MRLLLRSNAVSVLGLISCALAASAGCQFASDGSAGSGGGPGLGSASGGGSGGGPNGGSGGAPGGGSGGGLGSAVAPSSVATPPDASSHPDAGVAQPTYYLQLSSDDSTSMASAQIAKTGQSGSTLHRHEVLSYYDPPRALFAEEPWAITGAPSAGVELGLEAVAAVGEGVDGSVAPATVDLLFEMRAAQVAPDTRRPWHLVYCVDVSGSMAGEKIAFVRDGLARSLDHLRAGDTISLVTFDSVAHTIFVQRSWPGDEAAIRDAFASLVPLDSTNMMAGLSSAYAIAEAAHDPSRLSRVLLFGDGDANVGELDVERFASLTRIQNQEGIYLSSIGVGYGFDWARMDRLADAGKGASVFLPNAGEVERMFGEDFVKLVEVAADDVTIEMQIPEGLRLVDFTGEETSYDPDAPVPSIILASGDDLTFLARFEVEDAAALSRPVSLRVRYRLLGTDEVVTYEASAPAFSDLLREPADLYTRTRIVDDYARRVTADPSAPAASAVIAAIDAYGATDPGLDEIRALVSGTR